MRQDAARGEIGAGGDAGDARRAGGWRRGGQDTTPPPGLDISRLDDFQKKVFFRVVNTEPSICGQAQSLLQSAKKDPNCRRSFNAVRYVAHLVDQGFTDSEIGESLAKRYRNTVTHNLDVSEAPMVGSPGARITLVEFADYECPHCKRFQPVLRQILDEFKGEVKLYFKHYPLPQHTQARMAAEAATAAQKQGKFWPYEEKLWANQDNLTPAELEKYAKETGLDVGEVPPGPGFAGGEGAGTERSHRGLGRGHLVDPDPVHQRPRIQ